MYKGKYYDKNTKETDAAAKLQKSVMVKGEEKTFATGVPQESSQGDFVTSMAQRQVKKKEDAIFISYCPEDSEMVMRICNSLREKGYQVWINVEHTRGSELEAKAEAIEKSEVVLLCISEKYKNTKSCKSEAEYTYKKEKPFIPLLLQDGYDPDGWLGMMLGTTRFLDFSGKSPYSTSIEKLLQELDRLVPNKELRGVEMAKEAFKDLLVKSREKIAKKQRPDDVD